MIPQQFLTQWRSVVPWGPDAQIEQDFVITKALIQIYSDPYLKEAFAFRGGTAMQKLFYNPLSRYSEDIDLVQIRKEPIGEAIDKIREQLDPWLGAPSRNRKEDRVKLIYRFESEVPPVQQMRLKIEVNNGEHFTVLKHQRIILKCESEWFKGNADILTYQAEELLGTKMRALFQRKKGRDLYDLNMAFKHIKNLDPKKIVYCFSKYMDHGKTPVTRAQYEENLTRKMTDPAFLGDINPLLSPNSPKFDPVVANKQVQVELLSLLPGDPWKGVKDSKHKDLK